MVVLFGCMRSTVQRGEAVDQSSGTDSHDANWADVDSTHVSDLVESIILRSRRELPRFGITGLRAESLLTDWRVTLTSLLSPEWTTYSNYMQAKGLLIDVRAVSAEVRKEMLVGWGYYSESEMPADPLAAYQFAWEHPRQRHCDIARLRIDSIAVGNGLLVLIGGPDWNQFGAYGKMSCFLPPDGPLTDQQGDALPESDSAWIQFEVETSAGVRTNIRLTFFWLEQRKIWVPLHMAWGTAGDKRAFPLY
ncbi:MAG: hypothetical protein KIT68_12920 [Phycisphaeraceae bacterium]|nr:hypothetical protein [Phycisphaeraceae bacterium]